MGSSLGDKSFHREGFFGDFYINKLDVAVYYQHGWDSVYFGTASTPLTGLPAGARSPTWNGVFVEPHYTVNPQLIFFGRTEFVRMSQQALPTSKSDFGNLSAYTIGARWYPIMNARDGFAFHSEYSLITQDGTAPDGGNLTSSTLFFGFDFDF